MKRVILFLCFWSVAQAADLRVTSGAVDDQVFQRDSSGYAEIRLAGTADPGAGPVEARVTRKHLVAPGFDWTPIATAAGGTWSGTIRNLPVGGPYRIELRSGAAEARINNLLVGDLWVLAGQSNMQGVGDLVDVEMPHEMVHNFDMADRWMIAEEPLHTLAAALDPVHWPKGQSSPMAGPELLKFNAARRKGAGLGLPFAVEMVRRTGVPIGLLSCAHGGTSMDQWSPALKQRGGESLYGSTFRRVQAAGGRVAGVLWYQGESDANPAAAPVFQEKFERLIAAMREDFGNPALPFYYVQIGRHVATANVAEWNQVQEAQRLSETRVSGTAMVAAVDTSLDDGIHVGTQDLKLLGRRLANLAAGRTKKGPRPSSATVQGNTVRVAFTDVNGSLRAEGRISGFSIHGADGALLPLIYKARFDPLDRAAVLLDFGGKLPAGATLRYGAGKDPYCNVRDEAQMGLPVFGPIPIQ